MSVRDRARDLLAADRGSLESRVEGLQRAVTACRAHPEVSAATQVARAAEVLDRVARRLGVSVDHTVVAFAGATGSGKSSLFNAVCGAEVARPGVRRPTTTETTAAVWPAPQDRPGADAGPLLDWVGASRRHRVERGDHADLAGTVLLDLPDHDSTRTEHHAEVDRLSRLVDVFVWVVDPQKYADAALHERYLRPLRHHAARTVVVLNQVDRLPAEQRQPVLEDLRRLLTEDGLADARVLATSATRGDGLEELAQELAGRVADREVARARLVADVVRAGEDLRPVVGSAEARDLPDAVADRVVVACAAAAGVPTVVAAVRTSARRRGRATTGWPLTSWWGRMRPDPLRRLHLDRGPGAGDLVTATRSSLPAAGAVERAQVDSAVRDAVEARCGDLPDVWRVAARRAAEPDPDDLADSLDRAVVGVDLGVEQPRVWMRGVRVVQWLLVATALVGAAWLLVRALLGFLVVPVPDLALGGRLGVVPVPTLLLAVGVLGGVLLALTTRYLVSFSAARAAGRAERLLHASVRAVASERVLEPLAAVCDDQVRARRAVPRS